MKEKKTARIGVCGVLGIVFIVLKLVGVISWSWLWVLAPFWIPTVAIIAFILIYEILTSIIEKEGKK